MRTKILYEDAHLLVCSKPAGLAVQTAKIGEQDMASELKNYLKSQSKPSSVKSLDQQPYLGIIHRLDQPVEGLLVFAKTPKCASKLTQALSEGSLGKDYVAVVCGRPEKESGVLTDYLSRDPLTGSAAIKKTEQAKYAVLRYQVLKRLYEPFPLTLLHIRIETGRFHQIRAQMAGAGLPLLGDPRYGNATSLQASQTLHVKNTALCACRIAFLHPFTGQELCFEKKPEGEAFKAFGIL